MDENQRKIRRIAFLRGVGRLYHFTPLENLKSILTHGLLSWDVLVMNQIPFTYTDAHRLDGRMNHISLSVESVNLPMFKRKQAESRCDWVILEIAAAVLWERPCLFSWDNASASEIIRHTGFRGGPWAFEKMFEDCASGGSSLRTSNRVPDNTPTRPQAEVQVQGVVDPGYIVDLTVRDDAVRGRAERIMTECDVRRPIAVYRDIFA